MEYFAIVAVYLVLFGAIVWFEANTAKRIAQLRKTNGQHEAASVNLRRTLRMHYKRKKAKNSRAGCLMCKPHKMNGFCDRHKNMRHGNRKRIESAKYQISCELVR